MLCGGVDSFSDTPVRNLSSDIDMSKKQQHVLFAAIRLLLRPLVRILIRNGVAHGAFAELTKKLFVVLLFRPCPAR
jgi:hypothetical protein